MNMKIILAKTTEPPGPCVKNKQYQALKELSPAIIKWRAPAFTHLLEF